jgi:hypothetical protein
MTLPETPIPPALATSLTQSMDKLIHATQQSTVATLAAAIVVARGKPTSIQDVLDVMYNLNFAIFPTPSRGHYQEWLQTKGEALTKPFD